MRRIGCLVLALAAVILIVVLLACRQVYGEWPWEYASNGVQTVTVEIPSGSESTAGKDCLKQQAKLLAKAKVETKAKVRADTLAWHRHHPRAYADWDALRHFAETYKDDGSEYIVLSTTLPSGRGYRFDDTRKTCICHDFHSKFTPPPYKAPPPAKRQAYVPPQQPVSPPPLPALPPVVQKSNCFSYDVDTRGESNVQKPAVTDIEFYQHTGRPDDADNVMIDKCLYAVDLETGERLNLVRHCAGCETNGHSRHMVSPRDAQDTPRTLILTILRNHHLGYGCPSGHCRVFLPAWWVKENSVLWCWLSIVTYGNTIPMFAYFYGITQAENAADEPRGRYHVMVTPINHL